MRRNSSKSNEKPLFVRSNILLEKEGPNKDRRGSEKPDDQKMSPKRAASPAPHQIRNILQLCRTIFTETAANAALFTISYKDCNLPHTSINLSILS